MSETTMYTVSSSPHIREKHTTQSIMRDVIIALLPATVAGVYFFKMEALLIILASVISCVLAEYIWQKATNQKVTISDLSAVVTGLLLAFNLPASAPLWLPIIGGFFSIIIVKQFFGGLGQNIVNPALAGRAFLLASWPVQMTTWTLDGATTATPLAILKGAEATGATLPSLMDAFVGHVGGCIGETSALALLLGGAYLIYKKVIDWKIPATFIGTTLIITAIAGRAGNPIYELFVGGLMIGAIFMATDYATCPITPKGRIIFGIGCGVITSIIRIFGGYPEGVSYSILIMNLFVPLIERWTTPRTFGKVK
ncbi:RnfABCDGE type electron transport complex subunit D [Clostridium cochlearium]|jgi:electron transport complex protein RnfD|uniref:Ion-translocating oxidoreductase complex subunit D n=1 Tax=Clostridium cochlearium TaxID=1494 RepID=A0A239ZRA9_CLOCO|nr:RnfABCDGE type electron transport complex subunit D [Clostridium cochlearium]MBV1818847.1 RnfABCDGE type electron transport complex subunit D [Bacteroidales bacterium MSK.15.36]NSJ91565.1 RnfABCDGE type electron transport complex subunit D [Coprococcus sp. MSK.21.13]MBU5269332.1 RnfABCDGE type electron transport complex subunit D [Clostridium cochlearium]MCG4572757.1 RnfABCDGE type electron transport complex subunit D [Clostridium cochlearium]MCG4578851.1 RnfABCDGE type electron transport c